MTLSQFIATGLASKLLWTIVITFFICHVLKVLVHRYKTDTWKLSLFFATGGMPSSHTATTTALTIALAFETGASPLFFLAVLFTLITIRDSYGVRKSVSDQAHILNVVTSEMKIHKKAKIVLGHTPLQVFVGFVIGVLVSLALYVLA